MDVEKSRATADQQTELVHAQIAVRVAELEKEQLRLKGEREKLRLIEIAKGQREQTNVLGEARVYQLAVLDKVLQAAVANPNIVKIPNVLLFKLPLATPLRGSFRIIFNTSALHRRRSLVPCPR